MKSFTSHHGFSFLLFLFLMPGLSFRSPAQTQPTGKLFIMGGGKIPSALINTMIGVSGLFSGGYGVIVSLEEDSTACQIIRQFPERKIQIYCLKFNQTNLANSAKLDSLRNAKLIFFAGSDQGKLMRNFVKTPVADAVQAAYLAGAMVGGNSAGAALLGKSMLTGHETKHPASPGISKSLEAGNIEISEGLGLVSNLLFEPHFLQQSRMNRILSVVIEHPELTCIGIDESTSLVIDGKTATIFGEGQVLVIRSPKRLKTEKNGLLGTNDLNLSVYFSGDKFGF